MDHSSAAERLLVRAISMLLKTNEGILVEDKQDNDKQYIVWVDETSLRIQEFNAEDGAYETAAMSEANRLPQEKMREGMLLWMHDDTLN